jgi:hypothetical protein
MAGGRVTSSQPIQLSANPPTASTTNTQPARQRDDLETAADSTAAGPEPTAPPRGRLRRGRPQSEPDPVPPPAPRAPPRACSKAVGEMKSRAADT